VSTEKKPSEKEIWKQLSRSYGTDRAEQLVQLSHLSYDRGDYKTALALCESAKEIYESQKDISSTQELLHVYEGITWSLRKLDRDAEAAQLAVAAFEFLKEDHPGEAVDMLRSAGEFYFSAGETEKALKCHLQVMQEVDPDNTDLTIGLDHYSVGFLTQKLGRYDLAITHLKKAREYFKNEKDPGKVYYCDEYLAVSYIALNNCVDGLTHAQKALDFALTAQNEDLEIQARFRMGCVKVLLGEFDEALDHLRKALSMNVHNKDTDWSLTIDIEKEIANILVIKGQINEAAEINRRITTLEETLCA
jgi:tetratricopeptide (TPR) repeat protein